MSYNRIFWVDHVTEFDGKFKLTDNGDGTVTLEPVEGTILQQGTPQNDPNFNNGEEGTFAANELGAETTRMLLQHWRILKTLIGEVGETTLTNTLEYPFNDSIKTIDLAINRDTTDYSVDVEVLSSDGDVGKVEIRDKQLNGFKLAFTGGASSANLKYKIKGGMY